MSLTLQKVLQTGRNEKVNLAVNMNRSIKEFSNKIKKTHVLVPV